ncbi:MAG: hypothetical protein COB08_004670 [Rhodobacteraceae bacterium]|nr:hypothetical protein [Paracoccaceae bacterium]
MFFPTSKMAGLRAGMLITAFGISCANAGYAQSAASSINATSDSDYLSALTTMGADMDLAGLASQTFEPVSVVAPQLPQLSAATNAISCNELQAQANEDGRTVEIFGEDTPLLDSELAALSKCRMPDTGVLVSYLMPES